MTQFERALVLDPVNGRTREIRDEETMQVSINKDQLDAGKRLRVSALTPVFDGKTLKDKNDLLFDETGTGISTFNSNGSSVTLSVASGEYMVREAKMFCPYFPGKSQIIETTLIDFGIQTNIIKRHGYFSSSITAPYTANYDGIYLEADGVTDNTHKLIVSKNGTETINIARSDWDDKLDGTGASGQTINFDNFNIFLIDFLWLGGFRVRFGVALNDEIIWFHTYKHSNTTNSVMMLSPNQPIRTEIRSTTGTGSITMVCCDVSTEGTNSDIVDIGRQRSINTGTSSITVATTGIFYALLGMRLKSTHRDITVLIEKINLLSTTQDSFLFELRLDPTVANTFTYNGISGSPIEYAIGASNNTVTGGVVITSGFQNQQASVNVSTKNSLRLGSTIAGVMDTFVLCVSPLSTNMDIHASIDFRKLL